jgi:hypothetical protein
MVDFSAAKRAFGFGATKKVNNKNKTWSPNTLKVKRNGIFNTGRLGALQKAELSRLQLRLKSGSNQTIKAQDARLKYARAGCDELKKVIDSEQAGLLTRLGAVGSLGLKGLFMGTKSNIESAKMREADKKVARAAEDAERKYRDLKTSLVRAGIETQEQADKALADYRKKVQEKKEAVEESKRASNALKQKQKSNLNNAKWQGYKNLKKNNLDPARNRVETAKNKVAEATAEVKEAASNVQTLQSESAKKIAAVQTLTTGLTNSTRKQQLYNMLPKNRTGNIFKNFTNTNLKNYLRLASGNSKNLAEAAKRALNSRHEDPTTTTPKATNPFA